MEQNRKAIKTFLFFLHFDATLAVDGLDAKKILESKHFDLIVSDIEMPNMNGFEVLSFIKKAPAHKDGSVDALPVFDAVAEAGPLIAYRIIRAKGSGTVLSILFATDEAMDDLSFILFDPLFPVSGFNAAPSITPDSSSAGEAASSKRRARGPAECLDAPLKLKRILIVDDEPVALMLLQRFLSPYGRLDTAGDGLEAIEKVGKVISNRDPYDVVFLDIMIPGAPGSVVLEEIRKLEKQAGITEGNGSRIVMASSISDYTSISTSFKNQGDAYLVKPIDCQIIDKTMIKLGFSKMIINQTVVPSSKKITR